ncbi:MAG: carboxypeptidase-like regulatory domain-containing protein, partial [Bacteroidaceae bacterium]
MKVRNCKHMLLCGTLSLCLLGVVPQMKATEKLNYSTIGQQDSKVTGTVKDALGPIIGASIIEKGTTNGTITDMEGHFSLNVHPGATLVVRYVGYKSKEVKSGNGPLDIVIEEDNKMLNEVVVTALGIKRER